jgi:hypothetical protein
MIKPRLKHEKKLNIGFGDYKKPGIKQYYEGRYNREDIEEFTQYLSDRAKRNGWNGKIAVSLKSNIYENKFSPSELRDFGDDVHLFSFAVDSLGNNDLPDPEVLDGFIVYFVTAPKDGGADEHNDCLYNRLTEAIPNKLPWKTPEHFKKWLGVEREAPISIDLMDKIQKKLDECKICIFVTGDHIYESTLTHPAALHLKLIAGHYLINYEKYMKVKDVKRTEHKIIMYNDYSNTAYDGKDFFKYSEKMKKAAQKDEKKKELWVKHYDFDIEECKKKITNEQLKAKYDRYIKNANELKQATKGKINLYKTGTKFCTVKKLFSESQRIVGTPEPITEVESTWISEASIGPIMFATKGEYKNIHKYDIRSHYPSIMLRNNTYFPVKCGKFKTLDELKCNDKGQYPYGIYRLQIENTNKMGFRYNKKNKYTHTDIQLADELKIKWTLIRDKKPNALTYDENELVNGFKLFSSYVNILYPLKSQGIEFAKILLNSLWGVLTKKNVRNYQYKDDEPINFELQQTLIAICGKDEYEDIYTVRYQKLFETHYARLKPFLLAYGRHITMQKIIPCLDKVIRVHTDGWHMTEKMDEKALGDKIGQVKYEGMYKKLEIISCNELNPRKLPIEGDK